MSAYRLLVCLAVLGWSERDLARRTGRYQTTINRWTSGSSAVDDDTAAWLEALVAFHVAHPAPRRRTGRVVTSENGRLLPYKDKTGGSIVPTAGPAPSD